MNESGSGNSRKEFDIDGNGHPDGGHNTGNDHNNSMHILFQMVETMMSRMDRIESTTTNAMSTASRSPPHGGSNNSNTNTTRADLYHERLMEKLERKLQNQRLKASSSSSQPTTKQSNNDRKSNNEDRIKRLEDRQTDFEKTLSLIYSTLLAIHNKMDAEKTTVLSLTNKAKSLNEAIAAAVEESESFKKKVKLALDTYNEKLRSIITKQSEIDEEIKKLKEDQQRQRFLLDSHGSSIDAHNNRLIQMETQSKTITADVRHLGDSLNNFIQTNTYGKEIESLSQRTLAANNQILLQLKQHEHKLAIVQTSVDDLLLASDDHKKKVTILNEKILDIKLNSWYKAIPSDPIDVALVKCLKEFRLPVRIKYKRLQRGIYQFHKKVQMTVDERGNLSITQVPEERPPRSMQSQPLQMMTIEEFISDVLAYYNQQNRVAVAAHTVVQTQQRQWRDYDRSSPVNNVLAASGSPVNSASIPIPVSTVSIYEPLRESASSSSTTTTTNNNNNHNHSHNGSNNNNGKTTRDQDDYDEDEDFGGQCDYDGTQGYPSSPPAQFLQQFYSRDTEQSLQSNYRSFVFSGTAPAPPLSSPRREATTTAIATTPNTDPNNNSSSSSHNNKTTPVLKRHYSKQQQQQQPLLSQLASLHASVGGGGGSGSGFNKGAVPVPVPVPMSTSSGDSTSALVDDDHFVVSDIDKENSNTSPKNSSNNASNTLTKIVF